MNIDIMSPEDVIRWFKPQTKTEQTLVEKISDALVIGSNETDNLRYQNSKLIYDAELDTEIIHDLQVEIDNLKHTVEKLKQELENSN